MTDEANLNLPQVVRITADISAGVASQLSEVATLMNANRPTALHEAIVLTNLLYSEAAKRGKVVVPQGSMQKVIYLPKVQWRLACADHAATCGFTGLASLMVGGASCRTPWSAGFLTR
jgi:hypothetical protein